MDKPQNDTLSRRHFLGKSAAFMAAASVLPLSTSCNERTVSGDKNAQGPAPVLGVSTYSWRDIPGGLANVVKNCQALGIHTIEVLGVDMEIFLGRPEVPFGDKYPFIRTFGPRILQYIDLGVTAEERKILEKYDKELEDWRLNVPVSEMEKAKPFLAENGITAHASNPSISEITEEKIDYGFKITKGMGAEALISEVDMDNVKRLLPFAEKYGIKLALHNHQQFAASGFDLDAILALSPLVMLNFDVGNYYGSTGKHPNEIIRKYHQRIYSLHLKDMTAPTTTPPNTNQVWGQGETPLGDVLTLVRQEQYPFYCDIELEYDIKPWSDPIKETKKCIDYAKQ